MLRIDKAGNGRVVFTLSGRIQIEEIDQLRQLLTAEAPEKELAFNLKDVTLVNRDAVKFLGRCEAHGIRLENCPAYIRQWLDQARHTKLRPKH